MEGNRAPAPPSVDPIGPEGLPRIRALAYRIWPEAYAGILPADRIGPMLDEIYSPPALAADIAVHGHRYWLAHRDGEDFGFVSAYRADERVWIKKLYVLGTARGAGIGRRLMRAAITAHPGARSVGLYVNNANGPAIGFYRALGFAVESEAPVRMGPFDFIDYVMARPI